MPFKKGQSGNPKGRPKLEESWAGMMREICDEEVKVGSATMSRKEAIARKLFSEAAKGEAWAINALMDRMDGRPKQALDVDHTSGGKEITGITRQIVD